MTDPFADFRLDRTSAATLHEQVSGHLHALILGGTLPPRTKLPAEPVLAELMGVSRGTLRRATLTLIDQGVLVQRHGRGTFVADQELGVEAPFVSEITSFAQSFGLRGVATTTEVLALIRRPADDRSAAELEVAPGDEIIHLDRVRSDPVGPFMRLINVMRTDVVRLDDPEQLAGRGLYDLFEATGTPPAEAQRTIGAAIADGDLPRLLTVAMGHPILHIEQLTRLADGRPLEFSDVWIRADRLKLQVSVRRNP